MEPSSQPAPVRQAPVMDVVPPRPAVTPAGQSGLAHPPEEQSKENGTQGTANPQSATRPTAAPKQSNPATTAIVVAILFFLVLSALAFFAYTKSTK